MLKNKQALYLFVTSKTQTELFNRAFYFTCTKISAHKLFICIFLYIFIKFVESGNLVFLFCIFREITVIPN